MRSPCRFAALSLLAACAGGPRATSDVGAALAPLAALEPEGFAEPAGEPLAFGLRDGEIRNYFARQGPVAVHLLLRSGARPRVIAAFPADNQGIGLWFLPVPEGAQLSAGPAPDSEPSARGGELAAVVRLGGEREARGVRATLKSTATQLSTELVLLGNVRTLRDYGYGACLEDASQFPELRNESIEPGPGANTLRIRRESLGGGSMELLIAGRSGTRLSLHERTSPPRPGCPLVGAGRQSRVEIAGEGGIELELVALTDGEPLTPIPAGDLLRGRAGATGDEGSLELPALAFLSYEEKLLAGSWRFLTYFGRDTLLSLWMLLPALETRVAEAGIGAVLERVLLDERAGAAEGGVLARGDVAHEEELGDFAAWKNGRLPLPPPDLRQPRYDYGMVDDDFLLAPLSVALSKRLDAAAFGAFLARRRSDGRSFEQALLANLELVLSRARRFADDPRAPREKAAALVALHPDSSVGQWRDSEMGLAFGRYPFDVNAALVPAALEAAAVLYAGLGRAGAASEARRLHAAWQGARELFRFDLPLAAARANVASHASALGLADTSAMLEADGDAAGGVVVEYGIALDRELRPLPVLHSDHGFVLAFTDPPEPYLRRVAALVTRPFPAGLASPIGVLVANPGLADAGATVIDPRRFDDPTDDVRRPLRELFTPSHYHGAVVWSWQQALLAQGLRRQQGRSDLAAATRAALESAECELWRAIDATRRGRTRELWSWAPDDGGRPELRPFGDARSDADESNAIQLWSTVYLAIRKPTPAQNPRCGVAGVSPSGESRAASLAAAGSPPAVTSSPRLIRRRER